MGSKPLSVTANHMTCAFDVYGKLAASLVNEEISRFIYLVMQCRLPEGARDQPMLGRSWE